MNKYIFLIVVMFVIATIFIATDNTKANTDISNNDSNTNEIRSIYFSYIELQEYLKDKDEVVMKSNIDTIIKNMSSNNFNWLILQVRPFSDSIYPSSIFPNSSCVTSDDFSFDILEYFIDVAHSYNIKVHAWINPYRISNDVDFEINKDHPAYQFLNTNNIKVITDKGVFYNPASSQVTDLIISGIKEIINNYDIDGIHFDDYFYPSSDIDIDNYNEYISSGGNMTLDEYHLDIIKNMLRKVYLEIKDLDSSVLFGIAPEGNIDNNYSSNYLDVKEILSSSYLDYIMPQIYYGFENGSKPFIDTVLEWQSLIKENIMFIPALALYKSGNIDNYAKDGSNEWIENTDIIKRQVIYLRTLSLYDGFSIFRYDYLYNSSLQNTNTKEEVTNLFNILKNT